MFPPGTGALLLCHAINWALSLLKTSPQRDHLADMWVPVRLSATVSESPSVPAILVLADGRDRREGHLRNLAAPIFFSGRARRGTRRTWASVARCGVRCSAASAGRAVAVTVIFFFLSRGRSQLLLTGTCAASVFHRAAVTRGPGPGWVVWHCCPLVHVARFRPHHVAAPIAGVSFSAFLFRSTFPEKEMFASLTQAAAAARVVAT